MKRDIKVVEDINGYEAIYIDGFLKNEGNPLNEGDERILWFTRITDAYGVDIKDIKFYSVKLAECTDYAEFPNKLIEIINDIEIKGII